VEEEVLGFLLFMNIVEMSFKNFFFTPLWGVLS
jgi:hypothetical protein